MKAVHIYCKNLENVGKYKEENKYHLYLSSPFEKIPYVVFEKIYSLYLKWIIFVYRTQVEQIPNFKFCFKRIEVRSDKSLNVTLFHHSDKKYGLPWWLRW